MTLLRSWADHDHSHHPAGSRRAAGHFVTLAREAGFSYVQHVVALHAAVRDSTLVARPSFWQMTQVRRAHDRGDPAHLVVHEDVCVLAKERP